jgi:hypothetical protein
MNYRMMYRGLVTFIIVLVAAGLALAHEVTISYQAKLGNGPALQPGTYRLEVVKNQGASEAAFYQGKELVIRVPVTLVVESKKTPQTEVHYETLESGRVINQIRVEGWRERLVFGERPPTPVTPE